MFYQLYFRLTAKVMAAVLTAVLIVGAICFYTDVSSAEDRFYDAAKEVSGSELPDKLRDFYESGGNDTAIAALMEREILNYAGKLGLTENRSCYVLSARDLSVISPPSLSAGQMSQTKNLSAAMRGGKGEKSGLLDQSMDYAYFIKNGSRTEDGLIFYIRDNKVEIREIMAASGRNILFAVLIALLAAAGVGFWMTYTMVQPLNLLKRRIERFAEGDFAPGLEKLPSGEMGNLIRSFNRIGTAMNESIKQNNTQKHKVEVILEHINNGIIAFDTNQRVLHINPAAKRMFHIDNPETLRFDSFFQKYHADICMAEFMYLERSKTEKRELLVGSDHIKTYLVPFQMDHDKIAGVVCVFEDVTEQFNLESARQKFVAEVSHELKTPLTTIRTYTETLLSGYLDDKKTAASLLTTVENETDKMTALVQNLLILNRFDMQRVDTHKEFFSIDALLRRLTDMFRLEAEQKGLTLTYNRTTEIHDIYADEDQIERAVKNIISNSIRYCAKGDKIQIYAGTLYNNVYIKVEDSGKGIPKADLAHVFERFYRVDKARSREKGGTGLGLSITKEIIENHGGTIQIESEFGRFTRVTINLPANKVE